MSTLSQILSSRVRAEVFRLLFGLNGKELHLREMERRSGLSVATVRQELKKLATLGLVSARRDGNRLYFRANTDHPLHQDIRNLVLKTTGLTDVLREAIGEEKVCAAFVFGSIAQGTPNAESDVDLMVIGDLGLRELSRRLSGVSARLGREVNPHVLTATEFSKRREGGEHFVTSVVGSAKIFVVGSEHELAAMG